jgi:glutamate-1-semialdehyde aminotransferase
MNNTKLTSWPQKDFDFLEGLTKDMPRSFLVLAYNKSEALKAYFSKLSSTFWQNLTAVITESYPKRPYDFLGILT